MVSKRVHSYPPSATCMVAGCAGRVTEHWMCGQHAQRVRRYGDPLHLTPESERRSNNRQAQLRRHEGRSTYYRKFHGRHEHRVVMEQVLGRALESSEVVHHIDGDKRNNHPSNLALMSQSEHLRLHRERGDV